MRLKSTTSILLLLTMLSLSWGVCAQDDQGENPASPAYAETASTSIDPLLQAEIEQSDRILAERIRTHLALLPGMGAVQVQVRGGLVQLSGSVTEVEQIALAQQVSELDDTVLQVDNQINVSTDVGARLSPMIDELLADAYDLINALPLLAAALLIIAFSVWFGRWLSERQTIIGRVVAQPFLIHLIRQLIRLVIFGVGLLIALDLLNATALLGALLGTAGVAGIAFGFAFRDVAENYIAGILLSIRQPFMPKDLVVVDGHEGVVARLNSRATILITPDGNHLRLPNALVFKAVILNYTRNPNRRFDFELGVATDTDLDRACELAEHTLRALSGVLPDPAPRALISHAGDSTIVLKLLAWVDQRETDFGAMRSEAIRLVMGAFEREGIDMPDPGFRVDLDPSDALDAFDDKGSKTSAARVAEEGTARSPAHQAGESDGTVADAVQRDVSPLDAVESAVDKERASADNDRLSHNGPQE